MRWHDRLREYWEAWRHGVASECARPALERNADELAFLPAALEIGETPPPAAARIVLYAILAAFCTAFLWASLGQVDIVATAPGRLVPSGSVQVIQPLDIAVVRAIHVRDGDEVQAGQLLVELDPTAASADHQRVTQEIASGSVDVARLRAQVQGLDPAETNPPRIEETEGAPRDLVVRAQEMIVAAHAAQRAEMVSLTRERDARAANALAAQRAIERLESMLPLVRERTAARRSLAERQITPRSEALQLEEQLVGMEKELEMARANRISSEADRAASEARLDQIRAETRRRLLSDLGDAERRLAALREELRKAEQRMGLDRLDAPAHGFVQQLAIHTPGGVVTPAQQLMVIVPTEHRLEVEVSFLNQDVGFVREGQVVEVKVDALPFSKYGTIPGQLSMLSRDAVFDETRGLVYPARVELEREVMDVDGQRIRLTSGMSVIAELKTGRRRLIEFVLGPLLRYQATAFRER